MRRSGTEVIVLVRRMRGCVLLLALSFPLGAAPAWGRSSDGESTAIFSAGREQVEEEGPRINAALTEKKSEQLLRDVLFAALKGAGGGKLTESDLRRKAREVCEVLIKIANKDDKLNAADDAFADRIASEVFGETVGSRAGPSPPPPLVPAAPTVIAGALRSDVQKVLTTIDRGARKASIDNDGADLTPEQRRDVLIGSIDITPESNNALLRKVRDATGDPAYQFTAADRNVLRALIAPMVGLALAADGDTTPPEKVDVQRPKRKPSRYEIIEEVEEVLIDVAGTVLAPSPATIGALVIDSTELLIDSGVLSGLRERCRLRSSTRALGSRAIFAPRGRATVYYYSAP